MSKKIDISNQRFGSLVAIHVDEKSTKYRRWVCQCDCGNQVSILQDHLRRCNVKSCGCSKIKSIKYGFNGIGDIHGTRIWDIKKKAENRGLEYKITKEYMWSLFESQGRKCAISGMPIEFGKTGKQYGTASLDRIDNTKGYLEGNVQWVHKDINKMKNVHTMEYFISLCKEVAAHNRGE
jgi:hypothetical protein